jgi:hypothetical protein
MKTKPLLVLERLEPETFADAYESAVLDGYSVTIVEDLWNYENEERQCMREQIIAFAWRVAK